MMDWESLRDTALHCTACKLCQGRHHVVFGVGNPKAEIMFIGEGPGQHEDEQGEPFVGRSGQLMDKMLHYIDLDRSRNIYIANIVKCRPKGNRTPNIAEADFCAQRWLEKELEILQPKVIVALGSVALHYLGSPDMRITRDRGKWFKTRQGYDCIATYHPAYLLRLADPHVLNHAKWEVFYDLEAARKKAEEAVPDYKFMSEEKTDLFKLFKKR